MADIQRTRRYRKIKLTDEELATINTVMDELGYNRGRIVEEINRVTGNKATSRGHKLSKGFFNLQQYTDKYLQVRIGAALYEVLGRDERLKFLEPTLEYIKTGEIDIARKPLVERIAPRKSGDPYQAIFEAYVGRIGEIFVSGKHSQIKIISDLENIVIKYESERK